MLAFLLDILYYMSYSEINKYWKRYYIRKQNKRKEERQLEYLNKCKKKYKELFDYSYIDYNTNYKKIKVKCIQHDEFFLIDPMYFISDKCINDFCTKCKLINNVSSNIINNKNINIVNDENKSLFFCEIKVTHKETNLEFIKTGIFDSDNYNINNNFDFEIIDKIFDTISNLKKIELEYKEKNINNKFFLPSYIDFDGRNNLYKLSEEYQLKHSQIKFLRDSLLEEQNGKCLLCCKDVFMPVLDHYHIKKQKGTGLIRGVLCNSCNRMTGVIENNVARNGIHYSDTPSLLKNLAHYLESVSQPYIHPSEKTKDPKLMKSSYNKLIKKINGKQKTPKYNGKYTKEIEKLYIKYELLPEFKGSRIDDGYAINVGI